MGDMSEIPKSAKVYQFSDAIDENLDSKQAKMIAEANDFTELSVALEKIDVIQGTQKLYTADELKHMITHLRAYSNLHPEDVGEIEDYQLELPRMFGLRAKVQALLEAGK
jgi:hypothetical protein